MIIDSIKPRWLNSKRVLTEQDAWFTALVLFEALGRSVDEELVVEVIDGIEEVAAEKVVDEVVEKS